MNNNVRQVQLQIKAFNKAFFRAEQKDKVSDEIYEAITELIGPDRITSSGRGKAGEKYLANMTPEELLSYSADIEQARNLLNLDKIISDFGIEEYSDQKSLLWQAYDQMLERSETLAYDSDQVRDVAEGNVNIDYKEMLIEMYKVSKDPELGLSDFTKWFDEQQRLEE